MNWWQRLRNRNRLERELDDELRYHFNRVVEDNVRMGMSEEEARRHARLDFGGDDQLKESCRDARGTRWVDDTGQDFRLAARLLAKDRWFTLPAVLALALGIGMNGTMFTIVNAMIRGLPIDRPDQIMSIHARDGAGRWREFGVSYLDFVDFQAVTRTFAGLAAFSQSSFTLGDDTNAAERVSAAYVSANTFQLLRETPSVGRDFAAVDEATGAPPVVILGSRIWRSRYNADPAIIGRTVRVNGVPTTVVGVMPEGFRFPIISDAWQPLPLLPGLKQQPRDTRRLQVIGRRAEGITAAQAQAEIEAIAARLAERYPSTNATTGAMIEPFPGPFAPNGILIALMTAVGLILLVACINVANLLLARSVGRAREFSMRVALGATRGRVVRQLLAECTLLALAAGTAGIGFAWAGVRLFATAVSGITFPYYIRWTADARVAWFVAAVCCLTALLIGVLPTARASRVAAARSLTESDRSGATSIGRRRLTATLLTAEVALTFVLLSGAGLLMRSFVAIYRADSVIDASRVITMPIVLSREKYSTPEQRKALYERLQTRIASLPDVAASAFASTIPFAGGPSRYLSIDGRRDLPGESPPMVSYVTVRGPYFEALGLPLLRGRSFIDRDARSGSEGAIVNQRLAAMFFPNADAIGERICLTEPNVATTASPECATIVGVSATVRQQYFQDIDPVVYMPDHANTSRTTLLVRSSSSSAGVASVIRAEAAAIDADIALSGIEPLDRVMIGSRWGHRVFGGMLTVFALVGLLLAAVGLYAVTAFSVVQRTREIGVRAALGARPGALVWLFLEQASLPIGLGISVGFAGAFALGRLLRRFLIDTSATDPTVVIGLAVLLAAVCFTAAFLPVRRAAGLDPLAALRYE